MATAIEKQNGKKSKPAKPAKPPKSAVANGATPVSIVKAASVATETADGFGILFVMVDSSCKTITALSMPHRTWRVVVCSNHCAT